MKRYGIFDISPRKSIVFEIYPSGTRIMDAKNVDGFIVEIQPVSEKLTGVEAYALCAKLAAKEKEKQPSDKLEFARNLIAQWLDGNDASGGADRKSDLHQAIKIIDDVRQTGLQEK